MATCEVQTVARRELANGEYWMTFRLEGRDNRRRVIVDHDDKGVQRVRWADDQWQPYPPLNPADIGLRIDLLPESTRFESREIVLDTDTVEYCQASVDRVLDTANRPLQVGSYELYQRGVLSPTIVTVVEDETTGDLIATFHDSKGGKTPMRVDELSANVDFRWERITR